VPPFLWGESRVQQPQEDPKYLTINSILRKFPSVHTKTGPSKAGDVVTPPGPLSSGCRLYPKDLVRYSFLGQSGPYMAELTRLGYRLHGLQTCAVATKCHTGDSSQISHVCRLFFCQYSFSRHLRFMTSGEDRNKDRVKSWNLCDLWKHPFRHHGAIKLTQNQRRIQGGRLGRSLPLKPTKVYLFTIIFYNSENNIRDISPFCRLLFCHSSVVKYTSSLLQ